MNDDTSPAPAVADAVALASGAADPLAAEAGLVDTGTGTGITADAVRTPASEFWRKFRRQKVGLVAGGFVLLLVVVARQSVV